jgi:hypothetical protein
MESNAIKSKRYCYGCELLKAQFKNPLQQNKSTSSGRKQGSLAGYGKVSGQGRLV